MSNLGAILGWTFNHAQGIATKGDQITAWPAELAPLPTAQQIAAWSAEFDQQQAYRDQRLAAYNVELPPIGDQLDAIIKSVLDGDNSDLIALAAKIAAIKDRYPKPKPK